MSDKDFVSQFFGDVIGPVHTGSGDINIYGGDSKQARKPPRVIDFYRTLVRPCPYCRSNSVELENFFEREEPGGLLSIFEENQAGMHFQWRCNSCNRTGRKRFSGEYMITAASDYLRSLGYNV